MGTIGLIGLAVGSPMLSAVLRGRRARRQTRSVQEGMATHSHAWAAVAVARAVQELVADYNAPVGQQATAGGCPRHRPPSQPLINEEVQRHHGH
ncbi:hypothetical protein [Lentzea sp. E54]|uniref:hypothetical protein n=1 Tax=Lentzea xerophila TaxID=3435883 RepID=UPI003DA2741C